jgi:hypothetical protein
MLYCIFLIPIPCTRFVNFERLMAVTGDMCNGPDTIAESGIEWGDGDVVGVMLDYRSLTFTVRRPSLRLREFRLLCSYTLAHAHVYIRFVECQSLPRERQRGGESLAMHLCVTCHVCMHFFPRLMAKRSTAR